MHKFKAGDKVRVVEKYKAYVKDMFDLDVNKIYELEYKDYYGTCGLFLAGLPRPAGCRLQDEKGLMTGHGGRFEVVKGKVRNLPSWF